MSGIDPAWAIAGLTTIVGTLSTVVGILYRNQVKAAEAESRRVSEESRRKDELIDKLVRQISRAVDVQDRGIALAERTGPRR